MDTQNTNLEAMKPKSKNITGVLSVVFAGISMLGCWIPILNVISMFFGITAVILGGISLCLVLAKKISSMSLPIVGLILSIISLFLSSTVNKAALGTTTSSTTTTTNTSVSNSSSDSSNNQKSESSSTQTKEIYDKNDVVSINGIEISVNGVQRNYNPGKYSSPKSGQEFVKVSVKFENKSSNNISVSPINFKIQDSDKVIEDYDAHTYSLDDGLASAEIAPGGVKIGAMLFEVPKDDSNLILIYELNSFIGQKVQIKL